MAIFSAGDTVAVEIDGPDRWAYGELVELGYSRSHWAVRFPDGAERKVSHHLIHEDLREGEDDYYADYEQRTDQEILSDVDRFAEL